MKNTSATRRSFKQLSEAKIVNMRRTDTGKIQKLRINLKKKKNTHIEKKSEGDGFGKSINLQNKRRETQYRLP